MVIVSRIYYPRDLKDLSGFMMQRLMTPSPELESPTKRASVMPVVEASNIVKKYGTFSALSGVDMQIMPGEIYGLLGPNGAGKSTIIKIISGLFEPTSRSVHVMGYDVEVNPMEAKSYIGYVPESSLLYDSPQSEGIL